MVTIGQLLNNVRKPKRVRIKKPALKKCPQKRGICLKTFVISPKKPNSAKRKVARIKLTSRYEITAAIPGEGHTINEHAILLVRGGRVKDLPGVKYRVVRGALDATGVKGRRNARSRYGTPCESI